MTINPKVDSKATTSLLKRFVLFLNRPHPRLVAPKDRVDAKLFSAITFIHFVLASLGLVSMYVFYVAHRARSIWVSPDFQITFIGAVLILAAYLLIRSGFLRQGVALYVLVATAVALTAPFAPDANAEIGMLASLVIPVLAVTYYYSSRWALAFTCSSVAVASLQLLIVPMPERRLETGFALLIVVVVTSALILTFNRATRLLEHYRLEQLRESERNLKNSQKCAHIGSWRLDVATNQVVWSEELYKMYGFDPALPPPPYTEHMKLFTPESWERLSTAMANTRETGIPYELELETLRKDASNGWMWVRGEAITDSKGNIFGLWGAAQDITERKRAEEELQKLASVVRYSKELVNLSTLDGKMIFLNEAGGKMLGISPAEVDQTNIMQVIPEHLKGMVERDLIPTLMNGGTWSGDLQYLNLKTGKLTHVYATAFAVEDLNSGKPQFFANVSTDITERKRAEEEKAKLESQLHQAMKMEAVGQLAGGVAHDFNNLLTAIKGNVELALMDLKTTDPLVSTLGEVGKAADVAASLVRQLLAFSRKQLIEPKVLDLNDLISNLHKMLTRLIGEDIELESIPGKELGAVRVDPGQFEQIVVNLVVNARDAMQDGGKIIVETANIELDEEYCGRHPDTKPGRHVMLAVSDTGHGMTEEVKNHIFEPFFTTKEKGCGTGLGLATTYGTVKQSNGSVEVYSEEGKGTTFKIYLPRFEGKAEQIEKDAQSVEISGGTETVLLVEDEEIVRGLALKILERLGYKVMHAPDGDKAFMITEQYADRIDLLLTDVVMPGMSGVQLAERLLKIHPEMKVLYTSGYTENAIAHHGVVDKGLNFIPKPYTPATLAKKVREVLDRK